MFCFSPPFSSPSSSSLSSSDRPGGGSTLRRWPPGGISRGAVVCVALALTLVAVMLLSSCSLEQLRTGAAQAEQAAQFAEEQAAAAAEVARQLRAEMEAAAASEDPEAAATAADLAEDLTMAEALASRWEGEVAKAREQLAGLNAKLAAAESADEGAIAVGETVVSLLPPPYNTLAMFGLGAVASWMQSRRRRESRVAKGIETARDRELEKRLEEEFKQPFIVAIKSKAARAHASLGVTRDVEAGTV